MAKVVLVLIRIISIGVPLAFACEAILPVFIPDSEKPKYFTSVLVISVVLFVIYIAARTIEAIRIEHTIDRRNSAIKAIGDFIGQGNVLMEQVNSIKARDPVRESKAQSDITEWETQITKFLKEYDAHLVAYVFSTSEWLPRNYNVHEPVGRFLNTIGARIQKLEHLLVIVAMR